MLTIEQIRTMSPEEMAEEQRKLGRKIIKKILIRTAAVYAAIAVVDMLVKRADAQANRK